MYTSLFKTPERYMDIIRLLSKSKEGMARGQIATALKMSSGEELTKMLKDLVYCDLLIHHSDGGKKTPASTD